MKNLITFCLMLSIFSSCKKDIFNHDSTIGFTENLQILADNYIQEGLPGILLLVDNPERGMHIIESGYANLETQAPLTKNQLFHSASLMKTYTAVCLMQTEEAGLLSINDLIKTHLPVAIIEKIPNGEAATIRSLLNHSSGIPDFAEQSDYLSDLIAFTEGGPKPKDELEYIKNLNPNFEVGAKHRYCNTGFYILQLLISEVNQKPFEVYLHENVFQKIGLKNTYYKNFPQAIDYTQVPNYYIDWENNGNLSNSTNLENLATQTFEGYSGLIATIEDYHQFAKALFMDNTLINKSSLEKMMAVSHSKDFGYGQGLEVILSDKYPDKYGHKGGTQSSFFYYPAENTFVLSMLNYSFNTGESPFDKKAIVPDKIGKNNNLIGEIELCLFE